MSDNIIIKLRENKIDALAELNSTQQSPGLINVIRYKTEDNGMDFILAIGKKDGKGPEYYSVIQEHEETLVICISTNPRDVSTLIHKERALCYCALNESDVEKWYIIYDIRENGQWVRQFEELTEPTIFRNLDDGFRWFFVDGVLKREDDFISLEDTIDLVTQNIEYFESPTLEITLETPSDTEKDGLNYYLPSDVSYIEPLFSIRIINYKGIDETDKYTISLGNGDELEQQPDGKYQVLARYEGDFELPIIATRNSKTTTSTLKIWFPVTIYYGSCIISDIDLSVVTRTIKSKLVYHDFKTIDLDYKLGDNEDNEPENSILIIPNSFDQFYHIYDDNGLDYINDYNYLITFNYMGLQYQAYVKKDPVIQDSLKQKFTYLNECIDLPNSEWIRELDKEDYYTKEQIDAMYPRITIDGNKITIGDREFRLEPWIDTADYYIGIAGMTREVFYSKTKEQLLSTATPYTVQATPSYTHEYTEDEYGLVVFYIILKYNVSIESGDYRSGNLLTPYTPADFIDPTYFDLQYGSIAINGASYRVIGVRGVTFSDQGNMITLNLIKH